MQAEKLPLVALHHFFAATDGFQRAAIFVVGYDEKGPSASNTCAELAMAQRTNRRIAASGMLLRKRFIIHPHLMIFQIQIQPSA